MCVCGYVCMHVCVSIFDQAHLKYKKSTGRQRQSTGVTLSDIQVHDAAVAAVSLQEATGDVENATRTA